MNAVNGFNTSNGIISNLTESAQTNGIKRSQQASQPKEVAIGTKQTQKSTASAHASVQRESLKEIVKLLKNLIETLSTMIAKLLQGTPEKASSAPYNSSSQGTSSTSTESAPASSSPSMAGSSTNSSPTTSVESTSSTTTSGDTPSSADAASEDVLVTGVPVEVVDTTLIDVKDDLSVREAQEASPNVEISESKTGLQALKDETGAVSVLTDDGFRVRAEGREHAWTITGPDGYATRIWGDPHVSEHDGDKWDFTKQSTFVFGNNKVTVETVPVGDGKTVSARVTVYSGDERVTISGVNTEKPVIEGVARDGVQHDAELSDGDVYSRTATTRGDSWFTLVDGKKDVMGH